VHVIDWIGGAIKVYSANSMPPIAHSTLLTVDAIRRIPTRIRDSTDRTVRHARVQPLLEYLSHHHAGLPFMGTDLTLAEPTVNQVVEDADGQQHLLETPLPATQPPSPITHEDDESDDEGTNRPKELAGVSLFLFDHHSTTRLSA
jgi:hypothetical protein